MQDRHTSYTNTHTYARVHVLPAKASIYTGILKSQLIGTLHIEYCFQREEWDSNIQESEPLAEVKRPAGGDRQGSRLSIGRRRSSSMCRATSMVSSRSNSPSWSGTGSGLVERRVCQRELACLIAPRSSHRCHGNRTSFGPPKSSQLVSGSLGGTPVSSLATLLSDHREFIFLFLFSSVKQGAWASELCPPMTLFH